MWIAWRHRPWINFSSVGPSLKRWTPIVEHCAKEKILFTVYWCVVVFLPLTYLETQAMLSGRRNFLPGYKNKTVFERQQKACRNSHAICPKISQTESCRPIILSLSAIFRSEMHGKNNLLTTLVLFSFTWLHTRGAWRSWQLLLPFKCFSKYFWTVSLADSTRRTADSFKFFSALCSYTHTRFHDWLAVFIPDAASVSIPPRLPPHGAFMNSPTCKWNLSINSRTRDVLFRYLQAILPRMYWSS